MPCCSAHAPQTLTIVAVIGAVTALLAAHDRPRARTTSSACSPTRPSRSSATCSWRWASARTARAIFHLFTHAFFKALLFLGSGAVIHALGGRAGPAAHGRTAKGSADYLLDVPHRRARDRRRPAALRLLQQGRDPRSATFAGGHTLLWVVGMLTSLLTAFYMFRIVFLASTGLSGSFRRARAGRRGPLPITGSRTSARHASARRPAGDGARADRARRRRRCGYAACRLSCGSTGLPSSSSRVSAQRPRRGLRATSLEGTLMAVCRRSSRVVGHRHRLRIFFKDAPPRRRRPWPSALPVSSALLLNKYLRRRDLRRGRSCSRSGSCRTGCALEGRRRAGDRRRGQRRRRRRSPARARRLRRVQSGSVRAYAASLFSGVVLILGY